MLVASYDEDPPQRPEPAADSPESAAEAGPAEDREKDGRTTPAPGGGREEQPTLSGLSFSTEPPGGQTKLTVNVNINCSPDELDGLAPKIKRLLREIEGE